MTKIFSELVVNFDSIIINFSSRFHICFECDVQFSLISRLLIHTQKNCFKNFTCKHCEKTFASNNKFHEHVRLHYIRKNYNNKTLRQRFVEREDNYINSSISLMNLIVLTAFISSITFKSMTTSTTSIVSIVSIEFLYFMKFMIAFESTSTILEFSHYSIIMMNASIVCFFTSSLISFEISILSHITSKIYMIIKKLFEMFVEKTRRKNKSIIQKKSTFSCSSEFR